MAKRSAFLLDLAAAAQAELRKPGLLDYCRAVYRSFSAPPHIVLIANALERVESGKLKRLVISAPPRHGKSVLSSTLFPAWYLGRNPASGIICASHAQVLANEFGREVRNLIASDDHRSVFPAARISQDSAAVHRFRTERNGSYLAVGLDTSLTGRGGKVLLIDDPVKDAEDAYSAAVQRRNRAWYASVAYTRLEPEGAIVFIGARWHPEDLIGWVLEEHAAEGWEVITLPAMAEEGDVLNRREGDPLWPARFDLAALERIKAVQGSNWWPLYQQRPTAKEGAIFKRQWFGTYETPPDDRDVIQIVQSWDTAFKANETADYSVCTTWATTRTSYYLLDVWRGRVEFPRLLAITKELAAMWKPHALLIEDKASGTPLGQTLRASTPLPMIPVQVLTDKVARANVTTPLVEAGRVFIPRNARWLEDFLAEVCSFPASRNDDQLDSMTQALEYFRGGGKDAAASLWLRVAREGK